MSWNELDFSVCKLCGGTGMIPLTDLPDRTDWAVCRCRVGQQWRYDKQTDQRRRTHTVSPVWHLWAAEHNIPLRADVQSGKVPDTGSCIDLLENWYK